jgi:hypothetical protein
MSVASGEVKTPALFERCVTVYQAMLHDAKVVEEAGVEIVVWEGFPTTMLRDELKFSTPYYTSIFRALRRMGCARQLRRGGSSTPSQWMLIHEPTPELFNDTKVDEPSAQEVRFAILEQANRDLLRRVERLEAATGLHRVPIDYVKDPTPPKGIALEERNPSEWIDVDELDNEPGTGIVDG